MLKKLTFEEVKFDLNFSGEYEVNDDFYPQYEEVFKELRNIFSIKNSKLNLYIVDNFTKDNLNKIIKFAEANYNKALKLEDICYVAYEDESKPTCIKTSKGYGQVLKKCVGEIKELYSLYIQDIYTKPKDSRIDKINFEIDKAKRETLKAFTLEAKKLSFSIRDSEEGFNYIPIKDDNPMTEEAYNSLTLEERKALEEKLVHLRRSENRLIIKMKEVELQGIKKIRGIIGESIELFISSKGDIYLKSFLGNEEARAYLIYVFQDIKKRFIGACTGIFEEDKKIFKVIASKYKVNVIVDNSKVEIPIIFEDNPSLSNLIGNIEFKKEKQSYITDISLIRAGAILKANGGCIIINVESLLLYPAAYYYLKKIILNKKVDFAINMPYLDMLMYNSLKPEAIEINESVILIGDEMSFSKLFFYDPDFKNIFSIVARANYNLKLNKENKGFLINYLERYIKKEDISLLSEDAIKELIKYLCREAESRKEIVFKEEDINKVLTLANEYSKLEGLSVINAAHILEATHNGKKIEEEIFKQYENKKILVNTKGREVGQINGLSVIDLGFMSIGKPVRISCTCFKGTGEIIDIQKSNELSGPVHSKSISILKGYIENLLEIYEGINVNFNVCFEQTYGKIDGDSASVAEILCIISSLSKVPIKQNLAITGSMDQMGNVQPVGGINEKIEGFFKVCKAKGNYDENGVIIPSTNFDNIVLSSEVEKAISENKFHITTIESVEDAANVMMSSKGMDWNRIVKRCKEELEKYKQNTFKRK